MSRTARTLALPLSAGLALVATGSRAENIRCDMANGAELTFDIDRTQFAPAIDPKEPPRQQRTTVQYGDTQFPAVPFYLGETRGFEAEGLGGTTTLFVMQADGQARLSNARAGTVVPGTCALSESAQ